MNASSGDTIIQLVVATAGSGVLVTAIQGFFTRRKTRAEAEGAGATATKMITDAAASVVTRIQADNTELRTEVSGLRTQVRYLERWRDAAEDLFEAHAEWDAHIAVKLRDSGGIPVGAPPPLRPDIGPPPQRAT